MKHTFTYKNPAGKTIKRRFDLFCAPNAIEDFALVKEFEGFPSVQFRGSGWARTPREPNKVSFDQVEKIMAEADKGSAESNRKQYESLKNTFRENL